MSTQTPLVLIGIGTAGARMAYGVRRAFGEGLRFIVCDTDAHTAQEDDDAFVLLGGDRLAGLGAGGDVVNAQLAARDSIAALDERLTGVRLAIVLTCLGGGTGGGATVEIAKRLAENGIPSLVFATLPFSFEGEDRQRNANRVTASLEEAASSTFLIPLDKLVGGIDNMEEALRRATDTLASGIALFWRLVEKPGYIRLDVERLRLIAQQAGRGRFAVATCQGATRAEEAVDQLLRSELLATANTPVRAAICGVLAGKDLLLGELDTIANGLQQAFGSRITFDLGTVNDEETFSGRLSVVVLLFETPRATSPRERNPTGRGRARAKTDPLALNAPGLGRFDKTAHVEWHGQNLDEPTYLRKGITLEK